GSVELQQLTGEAVHHPDVVAREIDRAGKARVAKLPQMVAFLIKDLDAGVLAVHHPEIAGVIDHDGVCDLELAGRVALAAPRLHERAVRAELEDARIAALAGQVTLCDEEIAVRSESDVVRLVQQARPRTFVPVAGLPADAERHQHLALPIQLYDDMRRAVCDPDVAVGIEPERMRTTAEESAAEGTQQLAVLVELG